MAPTASVAVCKNVPFPALCLFGSLGNLKPRHGVTKSLFGVEVVDHQVLLPVIVDIRTEDAVNAGDDVINSSGGPSARLGFATPGVFQPERMIMSQRSGPIEISIGIDIQHGTVDARTGIRKAVEYHFSGPIRGQEETDFSLKTRDHIQQLVTIGIQCDRRVAMTFVHHDMFFPAGFALFAPAPVRDRQKDQGQDDIACEGIQLGSVHCCFLFDFGQITCGVCSNNQR